MKYKTDELLEQARLNENESSCSSAEKVFADENEAAEVFSNLREMLLTVDEWNEHSLLSTYALFGENGNELETAKYSVGKFVRISLKGTAKYDWIKVLDISETPHEFTMTVKPTFDPTAEKRDETVTSHFFTDESTNNFCAFRKNKTVALKVIGLHEKMNSSETKNSLETIRNAAVNLGSYLGVQKSEWEKFCHHFLEDAEKRV